MPWIKRNQFWGIGMVSPYLPLISPEFSGPGKGFVLPLQKYGYEVVDDIHVSIVIHYTVPTSLSFTWTMSHPTKGITGTVTYPQSLELVTNLFGLTEEQVHLKYNPGFLPSGL
jgi:hypothetical protein